MMWRPSSHQSQCTLPYPSTNRSWNSTLFHILEHPCQDNTSQYCWDFYLKNTYFLFKESIMNRCMGQPWDPPLSLLQPTCTEEFETKVINAATHASRSWLRYGDNTFVIQKEEHSIQFLQHISSTNFKRCTHSIHPRDSRHRWYHSLCGPGPDNTLLTTSYRKHTHTDQYLYWYSHHSLSARYSVFNTLIHRAQSLCQCPNATQGRTHKGHFNQMQYPTWALNRLQT